MPKLILCCNYLKNAPPSHLANYMNYISTREGGEKIDNTFGLLLATVKQKELIAQTPGNNRCHAVHMFTEERDSDVVKRVHIKDDEIPFYLISLINIRQFFLLFITMV